MMQDHLSFPKIKGIALDRVGIIRPLKPELLFKSPYYRGGKGAATIEFALLAFDGFEKLGIDSVRIGFHIFHRNRCLILVKVSQCIPIISATRN